MLEPNQRPPIVALRNDTRNGSKASDDWESLFSGIGGLELGFERTGARKSVSTKVRLPPAVVDVLDRLTEVAGETREEKILALIRFFFLNRMSTEEPLL